MDFGEFEEFRRIFTSFKKYYKNSFKHTNMSNTYYEPSDLRKFGNITEWSEELGKKFFDYYGSVFEEGALSAREKSLIALAVSHVVKCPYCIDAYTQDGLKRGITKEEMMETMSIANLIGGTIMIPHLRKAVEYWEILEENT